MAHDSVLLEEGNSRHHRKWKRFPYMAPELLVPVLGLRRVTSQIALPEPVGSCCQELFSRACGYEVLFQALGQKVDNKICL